MASDGSGNEGSAAFFEEVDAALGFGDYKVDASSFTIEGFYNRFLLDQRGKQNRKNTKVFLVQVPLADSDSL